MVLIVLRLKVVKMSFLGMNNFQLHRNVQKYHSVTKKKRDFFTVRLDSRSCANIFMSTLYKYDLIFQVSYGNKP